MVPRHSQSLRCRSMQGPRYPMLVHLAMLLCEVSGWRLPSDDKAYDSSHEFAITGEVDSARDRRRLAWPSCNTGWCVPKPRPCVPPLRHLVSLPSCPQWNIPWGILQLRHGRVLLPQLL